MNFNINMNKLKELILEYAKKHELAVEYGSEYIYLNGKTQADALDLVCDIFDNCIKEE